MKTSIIHILSAAVLIFYGCETTVDDADWPEYEERIVVIASLQQLAADSSILECKVRRTLPLWEDYDLRRAVLPTAKVTLVQGNDSYNIPLVSSSDARYVRATDFNDNETYTLTVEDNGRSTQASVHFPEYTTSVAKAWLGKTAWGSERILLQFPIDRNGNYAYEVIAYYKSASVSSWRTRVSTPYISDHWSNWEFVNNGDGTLIYNIDLYQYDVKPNEDIMIRAAVNVFSSEYSEYSRATYSGYNSDEFFGGTPKNPEFNFTGDGIGFLWTKRNGEFSDLRIQR